MVRLAITGVSGRMGQAVARLALASPEVELVAVTTRQPSRPSSLPSAVPLFPTLEALLGQVAVDVVVDFTVAETAASHARACAAAGVPLVLGTTGLSPEGRAAVEEAAGQVPVVFAPNFSVGVTVLLQVAAQLSRVLQEGFDVEVLEVHHRRKRDAPSGTALRLAEVLTQARGLPPEALCLARQGLIGERPTEQVGVQTLRGGDVVGEHTVYFLGEGERVELTHRATSRDTFAAGALRAARWVQGRPAGLHDMVDVLGMKEGA